VKSFYLLIRLYLFHKKYFLESYFLGKWQYFLLFNWHLKKTPIKFFHHLIRKKNSIFKTFNLIPFFFPSIFFFSSSCLALVTIDKGWACATQWTRALLDLGELECHQPWLRFHLCQIRRGRALGEVEASSRLANSWFLFQPWWPWACRIWRDEAPHEANGAQAPPSPWPAIDNSALKAKVD